MGRELRLESRNVEMLKKFGDVCSKFKFKMEANYQCAKMANYC